MNTPQISSVIVVVVLAVSFSAGQTAKRQKQSCWDSAHTQMELNACAGSDATRADAELNRIYSLLLQKLKSDPVALSLLKESERQWLKYRDAQMKALHPHPNSE